MLIRLGYDLRFETPTSVPIVALLHVHPSREKDLREPDTLLAEPEVKIDEYIDTFGNHCSRFVAPAGSLRLHSSSLIEDSGEPDAISPQAREVPVGYLPTDTMRYLLASRYCETDLLSNTAVELFGGVTPGWERVQAICSWVHSKVTFGYPFARPTKTALDVYVERQGVCRDFQHLAIAFCRCLNIPARYATGYLGDIGIVVAPAPMDFSAWFQVYLEDRWWTVDARHNARRIGRVLMAVGRDAADVAITTSFGTANLTQFVVVSDEVQSASAGLF
jgi:transglutaminase-like putative cysteine protease